MGACDTNGESELPQIPVSRETLVQDCVASDLRRLVYTSGP